MRDDMMVQQQKAHAHEQVSALIDGEVRGEEFDAVMALLEADAQARAHWHVWHVTSEALRGDPHLVSVASSDADFMIRLQTRLAQESTPQYRQTAPVPATTPVPPAMMAAPAANDAGRWKQVAVVATLGLAAVLGWQLGLQQDSDVAVSVPQMLRDPQLDALLAAHRQHGGASALLKPAGFLRNATFEPSSPP